MLSEKYGVPHDTPYETIYSFPTVDQLSRATAAELSDCKLGYRVPYIIDAIAQVSSHSTDLDDLYSFDDETLLSSLKNVKGVGDKVANCIALFAYGRIALAPVDTWIRKVIDDEYAGVNPFPGYGSVAGIMQQYAFFYAQGRRGEKSDAGEA
jgi:N-glycosylase/DNA lyase